MRAVLLFLTGRLAGHRQPVIPGALPAFDATDGSPSRVRLDFGVGGWTIRNTDPAISLRVNGRLVRERQLRDGDIIGCGRILFRLNLAEDGPAESAPRRTITLADVPRFAPRQQGLSTVVTAPGRWGNVAARWYGGTVLHLQGPEDPHPEQLVARLGQRIRCHALLSGDYSLPREQETQSQLLTSGSRLVPLTGSDPSVEALIRELWRDGSFVGILSPLEPQILSAALAPLSSLLAYPQAVRPFLCRPEAALIAGMRSADASLLCRNENGWELFCCPEILPLARRLGLPDRQDSSGCDYTISDADDGLVRISGPVATSPAHVARLLASRDSLQLLVDSDIADTVDRMIPSVEIEGGTRGTRRLFGPSAGEARFELVERFWGRGGILGLLSSRSDREIERLARQIPARSDSDAEPFGTLDRDQLGGFEAVYYDPANATWAIFADPRPKPVWQRYGLPAPVLTSSR